MTSSAGVLPPTREFSRAPDIASGETEAEATGRGADAVVAVDLDVETIGASMLMVSASGTAVRLASA